MLTISSAPAAAQAACGPSGTHRSSQIVTPKVTPPTWRSRIPAPGVKYRFSSKTP